MNCRAAIAALDAHLDGQLPAATGALVAAHVAQCPRCRARYADEAQLEARIAHALRAPADPPADEAAWARALARALPAVPASAARMRWWGFLRQPPTRRQLRWMALAASLALLATFSMAGLGLRRSLHVGAPPSPDPHFITAPGSAR